MSGNEEEKKEPTFEDISEQINKAHQGISGIGSADDLKKILQATMDSIEIFVPLMEIVSLENVTASEYKEIKLIELPCKKQVEYERMAVNLQTVSQESLNSIKENATFDSLIDLQNTEMEHQHKMVIHICDNGLNLDREGKPFVTKEFCENVLGPTMISYILFTYMKKFATMALMERMKLINFFTLPVMLSNRQTQKNSGETG